MVPDGEPAQAEIQVSAILILFQRKTKKSQRDSLQIAKPSVYGISYKKKVAMFNIL